VPRSNSTEHADARSDDPLLNQRGVAGEDVMILVQLLEFGAAIRVVHAARLPTVLRRNARLNGLDHDRIT